MATSFENEMVRLNEELKRKEVECERLKRENEDLKKKLDERDAKLRREFKEEMELRFRQLEQGRKEEKKEEGGVFGEHLHSTPKTEESLDEESDVSYREEESLRKKKKSSKKRRHERRMKARVGKSRDSLYSNGEGDVSKSGSQESEEEEYETEVHKSIVLREPPKIEKLDAYGRKDVNVWFREFESYCKEKLGENKKFWVNELGNFLVGRLTEYYREIIRSKERKYEVVKERLIAVVKRMKGSVKYRKKDLFEDARMGKDERVGIYAQRLETLAREKFGDDDINSNKALLKKFIATVPERVAARINARRKEMMTYRKTRMMWEDVLELVEDESLDDVEEIYKVERSYSEVLKSTLVGEMKEFLDDYYKENENRARSRSYDRRNVYVVNGRRDESTNRWRKGKRGQRDRSVSQGRNGNMNAGNRQGEMNGGRVSDRTREIQCFRCGRLGHMKRECRWALGVCFGCGMNGHFVRNCPNTRGVKCYSCGRMGHRASECTFGGNGRNGRCGNCGESGHYARMCNQPRTKCGNCGLEGHVSGVCNRGNRSQEMNVASQNQGNGV